MSITRIASRYAKSLLDLAKERGELDIVLKDIQDFFEVTKNRDFYLMAKSPIINSDKKAKIFDKLFKGKYSEMTLSFFHIIIRKGREMYLPEIARQFLAQYKILNHISTVRLTSAVEIKKDQLEQIKARLLESDITDENIELITNVNSDLIGGFVIEIGDKLYDASVTHILNQLRKEFSDNLFVK